MTTPSYAAFQHTAGPVSRETFDRLRAFEPVFLKWAKGINLSASSTLSEIWTRHIEDSAQLAPLAPEATAWLDLGSGGGFPGLVMGFLLADRPRGHIDLVESNRKKAGFLSAMVGQFSLPARVHANRIEDLGDRLQGCQVVTARALASLPTLLDLAAPWLASGAIGLFHKGRDYRPEVQQSIQRWGFDLVEHASKTEPQSVILEIRNLRRREKTAEAYISAQ